MAFALGLIMWMVGGITFLHLVYKHFGSTGLWFIGAFVVADLGSRIMKEAGR